MIIENWNEVDKGYWMHSSGIYGIYLEAPYNCHKWIAELERHSDEIVLKTLFDVSTEKEGREKLFIILNNLKTVEDIESFVVNNEKAECEKPKETK